MTPQNDSKLPQGRLLIIDDEPELREVLIMLLEDSVGSIAQASNGLEAIALLQNEQFDAVLSDEKMPKKSGLDVLKWMREQNMQTPFIIHTGYSQSDIMIEAQKLSVFGLIEKPWIEKHLIQTVTAAVSSGLEQNKLKSQK